MIRTDERREQTERDLTGPVLTKRGFWGLFWGAWLAYAGLSFTMGTLEGWSAAKALPAAACTTLSVALPAFVVALRRRELLRPERPLWRTAGIHLGIGLLYALAALILSSLFLLVVPVEVTGKWAENPVALAIARFISALLLYLVLMGFLMWTESMERVQESRDLAAREAMLRAQAEAKSLRAQFNPHFVFNTLHSLMLLVRADPSAAERAIEDVAALIRYASVLQRRGVDAVPLGQELGIARRYMALEKLRLGDRLRVEWQADPALEGLGVPAFALQTLLENAVKHGVSPRPEGGTIRVRVDAEEESLVLVVEDDGEGAEPRHVRDAAGRGLDLLERRLVFLYGAGARLSWRTAPGEGFRVTLRVPANAVDSADVSGWLGAGSPSPGRHDPAPTKRLPLEGTGVA